MKGNISISDFIIRIIFLVSLSGYLFPKKKKNPRKIITSKCHLHIIKIASYIIIYI